MEYLVNKFYHILQHLNTITVKKLERREFHFCSNFKNIAYMWNNYWISFCFKKRYEKAKKRTTNTPFTYHV